MTFFFINFHDSRLLVYEPNNFFLFFFSLLYFSACMRACKDFSFVVTPEKSTIHGMHALQNHRVRVNSPESNPRRQASLEVVVQLPLPSGAESVLYIPTHVSIQSFLNRHRITSSAASPSPISLSLSLA